MAADGAFSSLYVICDYSHMHFEVGDHAENVCSKL
jgi:hypothetical protein